MPQPNVLLIISDQHRPNALGFRGETACRTPYLDALAQQGVAFDGAVCTSPLCGPSRASIFTGRYAHQVPGVLLDDPTGARGPETVGTRTDMMTNFSSLKEPPLLTDRLKGAGYYTSYAGKWHLGDDIIHSWFDDASGYSVSQYLQWAEERGLSDAWPLQDPDVRTPRVPHMSIPVTKVQDIDPEHTNDAWIADLAVGQIRKRPKDRPFFATCAFNGPHPPFKIPEPYYSMYDPSDAPEPPNFYPSEGEPACKEESFYRILWRDFGENWDLWRKSVAVYWGFVTLIDDQVGKLLAALEEEGVAEDTLVIYCSDHGEMLGRHGLWHKMQPYEESLRIPLIVRPPRASVAAAGATPESTAAEGAEHQSVTAPASLIDLPSTILSFAGLPVPDRYEGVGLHSLVPEWGGNMAERAYVFSEHKALGEFHREVDWRLVTDNRLKYVWNLDDRDELYDLERDRWERENLADDPAYESKKRALQRELGAWMERTGDPLVASYQAGTQ